MRLVTIGSGKLAQSYKVHMVFCTNNWFLLCSSRDHMLFGCFLWSSLWRICILVPFHSFKFLLGSSDRRKWLCIAMHGNNHIWGLHKLINNSSTSPCLTSRIKILGKFQFVKYCMSWGWSDWSSLQKEVSCLATMVVAYKLERHGCERFALVLKTNCRRQPKRQLPSLSYNPQNICEGVITSALQSCSKYFYNCWV